MAFFWSTPGPSPCPWCDGELGGDAAEDPARTVCPWCDGALAPAQTARSWRRFSAFMVDSAILMATAGPLNYALLQLAGSPGLFEGTSGIDAILQLLAGDPWRPVTRVMPFLLMAAGYFVMFTFLKGQTPGQRLLRIRLVDRTGAIPGPLWAAVRVLATGVGLVPGALGSIWMAFDAERRALQDHVAGTFVVRDV